MVSIARRGEARRQESKRRDQVTLIGAAHVLSVGKCVRVCLFVGVCVCVSSHLPPDDGFCLLFLSSSPHGARQRSSSSSTRQNGETLECRIDAFDSTVPDSIHCGHCPVGGCARSRYRTARVDVVFLAVWERKQREEERALESHAHSAATGMLRSQQATEHPPKGAKGRGTEQQS